MSKASHLSSLAGNGTSTEIILGDSDVTRLFIPGLGLNTDSAANNQALFWNDTSGHFEFRDIPAGTDSAAVTGMIDSAYIQARQAPGTDSAAVLGIVDSAYINSISLSLAGLDSTGVRSMVDSDFVSARMQFLFPSQRDIATFEYVSTQGQSIFTGADAYNKTLAFNSLSSQVYLNGILLSSSAGDYVESSGNKITIVGGLDSGNNVVIQDHGNKFTQDISLLVDSAYVLARIPSFAASSSIGRFKFTTAGPQTVFTGADSAGNNLSFSNDHVTVSLNGVNLIHNEDYTASGGNTITLSTATDSNFELAITSFTQFYQGSASVTDSAAVISLIDSSYVQARQTPGTDSAATLNLLKNSGTIDFGSNAIKYANVYAQLSDLPSASTYHGMFAHVHATGAGYYAHAGNWIELANLGDIDSDYVQARQTPGTDSAAVLGIVDSAHISGLLGVSSLASTNNGVSTLTQFRFTADSGQATFSGNDINGNALAFSDNNEMVYFNGSLLFKGASADYTTGANSVTLSSSADSGDDLFIVNYAQDFYGGGAAPSLLLDTLKFTADSSQTAFTGSDDNSKTLAYKPGNALIFLNGMLLIDTLDYTASNGTSVVLNQAANLNDELVVTKIQQGTFGLDRAYQAIGGNYTIGTGQRIIVDTSSARTITLPVSASLGDEIRIVDGTGNAATNNITVDRNNHKINGGDSDLTINVNRAAFGLTYYNATNGWILSEK